MRPECHNTLQAKRWRRYELQQIDPQLLDKAVDGSGGLQVVELFNVIQSVAISLAPLYALGLPICSIWTDSDCSFFRVFALSLSLSLSLSVGPLEDSELLKKVDQFVRLFWAEDFSNLLDIC